MALIDANWDEVPEKILPIDGGTYDLEVIGEPTVGPTVSGDGQKVSFQFAVVGGEFQGRRIFDDVGITKNQTRLKQVALACGLAFEPGQTQLDLAEFVAKQLRAVVRVNTYTNRDGDDVQNNKISQYMFDSKD